MAAVFHPFFLVTLSPFGRFLRPVVAILLTGFVLWRADPTAVLQSGARADLRWIGLAVLLVIGDRALMAWRWIKLLCPIPASARPPLWPLLQVFFVSTFAGTFLPARVGGDLVRAYGLARLQGPRAPALASVLMDRLLGVVAIVGVGLAGLVAVGPRQLVSNVSVLASLAVAAAAVLLGGALVFSEGAADWVRQRAERLPIARVRALVGELTVATRAYALFRPELAHVLFGSVAVQAVRIIQAYCLGRALGISAPFVVYTAFVPIILLIMLLPISINGIGPSQAGFVWLFGLAGTPAADAFALSVLFVALGVVGNLPGGVLYARSFRTRMLRPQPGRSFD